LLRCVSLKPADGKTETGRMDGDRSGAGPKVFKRVYP